MAKLEATGALEDLLRQQRSLVDQTLHPLLEGTPLGDLLRHFQATLLALQAQEPSFWQLQVVEFIRDELKTRVGGCVRDAVRAAAAEEPQDPVQVVARAKAQVQNSSELEAALVQLKSDVEEELARLTELLSAGKENRRQVEGADQHFLERFWDRLQALAGAREMQPKSDEEREAEEVEETESCSFEMLTFDEDLNDLSRSAMSFPCMEDFPGTIIRMQSVDALERAAGLDELMQMPVVEIIHSGPTFLAACSAVVGLFLDVDVRGERFDTAERAKRLIFDLMNQVEDASQFLELYGAVLEFMGLHLETETLYLDRQTFLASTDAYSVAVLDCFRVLHALICRVTRHWVYFSADALARVMYSTFYLLTMYSKAETEVEVKRANPFLMMSLVDDSPMQWLRLWLLNCPSLRQLFVALDESGFIADLLQYMSRVRPLTAISSISSIDAIEIRVIQDALVALSYICEYHEGRELVSRWQRVSAHTYIKGRHIAWGRPALQTIAAENDALFRGMQPDLICEDKQRDELEADYEHLGAGAIDALILSIASMLVTLPRHLLETNHVSYDYQWTEAITNSAAMYLHAARDRGLIAGLAMISGAGWVNVLTRDHFTAELEEKNPWFPFRQPKDATEVCELVVDSVSKRIRSGTLSSEAAKSSGLLVLQMMLQGKAVNDSRLTLPDCANMRLLFEACRKALQSREKEAPTPNEAMAKESYHARLLELMRSVSASSQTFKIAQDVGIDSEAWKSCTASDDDRCNVGVLCQSVTGIRYAQESSILNTNVLKLNNRWSKLATVVSFQKFLPFMSVPEAAKAFFSLDGPQTTIYQVVRQLQESVDFTEAINSSEHECAPQLSHLVRHIHLLRCCLSTQYASSSLLLTESRPLIGLISKTLSSHVKGDCIRSCHAEDTCCVSFLLVLSLVSSVPALLDCSSLLAELNLLHLDVKSTLQRDVLCDDSELLGSCSLLEKQLRYDSEFVGGPSERITRCELFVFDGHSRQNSTATTTIEATDVSDFIVTLQNKILQAVQDGVKTGSSMPMDFVLISQASWEIISDLETKSVVLPSFGVYRSAAAFTKVFAKLMYSLVTSNRSRLEALTNSNTANVHGNTTSSSSQNVAAFFPTDSERKLMNRLYKNYAKGLSLDSSPTLLHCIVKKFGKVAMDCFPVSMLMILHPTYGEADILRFLSHCNTTWSGRFLWPRSAPAWDGKAGGGNATPAIAIAEGVEIIMEREFPQILQAIDQCQCSLLSLVLRWHSQNFWNYFDWENIVVYTYFSIVYGAEFQVYIIVAILKHLEPTMRDLIASHSTQSLSPFLVLIREPIRNFRFSPWRTLLLRLRSEYHEEVRGILFPHAHREKSE